MSTSRRTANPRQVGEILSFVGDAARAFADLDDVAGVTDVLALRMASFVRDACSAFCSATILNGCIVSPVIRSRPRSVANRANCLACPFFRPSGA